MDLAREGRRAPCLAREDGDATPPRLVRHRRRCRNRRGPLEREPDRVFACERQGKRVQEELRLSVESRESRAARPARFRREPRRPPARRSVRDRGREGDARLVHEAEFLLPAFFSRAEGQLRPGTGLLPVREGPRAIRKDVAGGGVPVVRRTCRPRRCQRDRRPRGAVQRLLLARPGWGGNPGFRIRRPVHMLLSQRRRCA